MGGHGPCTTPPGYATGIIFNIYNIIIRYNAIPSYTKRGHPDVFLKIKMGKWVPLVQPQLAEGPGVLSTAKGPQFRKIGAPKLIEVYSVNLRVGSKQ